MNDKQAQFPAQLRDVQRRDVSMIRSITINLAVALTDQTYHISGNYFYVFTCPSQQYVSIKVNESNQPSMIFYEQTGLKTPFDRLLITTPAGQAGNAVLLYATEAPILAEVIDNRAALNTDIAALLAELQGDTTYENYGGVTVGAAAVQVLAANANRKACWFRSLSTNTQSIFLGFTNAVTAGGAPGTWFEELTPGAGWGVDDYRGDIYAIAGGAGQILGVGEW